MTRRLLIALALAACSPSSLPPPRIVALNPPRMQASDAISVQIQLEAVLPFQVDFGQTHASADPKVSVVIGGRALAASELDANGYVSAFVPSAYAPGAYDLTVRLADGRATTAPGAFTVDPGPWPDSYEFLPQPAPIADQVARQPFLITVRAMTLDGGTDVAFKGTVGLSANHGTVTPDMTGPFDAGVVIERFVTIDQELGNVSLIVTDMAGHSGTSNPFKVSRPPP